MSEPNYHQERIDRLLHELQYELELGWAKNEIDEEIAFRFVFPISRKIPQGVIMCELISRPIPLSHLPRGIEIPRLKLVK